MGRIDGTMGLRIRSVRNVLKLTQQEFSDRIGVKRNTIANYEIGRNDPVDSVLELICREYNVSREWLRTGEGEMFEETPETWETKLEAIFDENGLQPGDRVIVREFLKLPPEDRQAVLRYVEAIGKGLTDVRLEEQKETPEQRRERLHRELDRQLDEEEAAVSASSQSA